MDSKHKIIRSPSGRSLIDFSEPSGYSNIDEKEMSSSLDEMDYDSKIGLKSKFIQSSSYYFKSNLKDIVRHKCHFWISTLSIFIVVLMALVIYSVIDKAPIIFLRLAEKNSGEIDAYIYPNDIGGGSSAFSQSMFNFTKIKEVLLNKNLAPRQFVRGQIKHIKIISDEKRVMFIDTDLERKINLGKDYKFPKMKKNECIISQSTMVQYGLSVGGTAKVRLFMDALLFTLAEKFQIENNGVNLEAVRELSDVHVNCTIVESLKKSLGKIDKPNFENVVILEYEYLFEYLKESIKISSESYPKIDQTLVNRILKFIEKEDPYAYAGFMVMTFPESRLDYYKNPDYNELMSMSLTELAEIETKLGYYPPSINLPLLEQLQKFNLAILFMGLLFSMILALFVVISVILIYGLLLVNVQQKSFEIGIKRMVGQTKFGLIKDVLFQTFFFSTPGIILAFMCSFVVLRLVYYYEFEKRLNLVLDPNPTWIAIYNAFFLGIVIPLASWLMPIKAALSRNLNDALDFERSQTKAVVVSIIDSSSKNNAIIIIFGLISVIYGMAIYVLLPQCMLALDFGTILKIFFLILIGMLFGLILITMNFQFIIEMIITKALFWWEKKSIRMLIIKNLIAHRMRNSSTTLVYALSLSFLILCVVSYSLQIQNVTLIQIRIFNEIRISRRHGIDIISLEAHLKELKDNVETFGYKSIKLNPHYIKNTYVTAHSRFFNQPVEIVAVSPYLFDAFRQDFINVGWDDGSTLPLSEQLYTLEGAHSAGVGTHLANKMHVFTDQAEEQRTFMINTQSEDSNPIFYYKVKAKFTLDSAPALKMGKRVLSREINIVISLPDAYNYIEYGRYYTGNNLKFNFWYVKLNPKLTKTERKDIIASFGSFGELQTIDEAEDQLEEVRNILDVIFNIIITLSMFLCLFSLISSTSANMMEQTKEIGVLRAIGYTKYMIKRLYFYETFVLVFASSWLGIIVGTFVGWTMTVQQAEFISIPIAFYFPYRHLFATGLVSILCSFIAIYSPTSFILSRQISEIFRIN